MTFRIVWLALVWSSVVAGSTAWAKDPAPEPGSDVPESAASDSQDERYHFKITSHLMAPKVGFDKRGSCKVARGRMLKAWRVNTFPAQIPSFESCLTVRSSDARGLMDLEFNILDKNGESLQRVEGAIDLGDKGSASQAINWEHLEIPAAGLYHMQVIIEGHQVARYPMHFKRQAGKRRGK